MAAFEKPWRETLMDLFGRLVGGPEKLTTLHPGDPYWLHSLWPGLSDPLAKPTPIPQRGTSLRYGQIQRAQKLLRRRRDGPKYRRKGPEILDKRNQCDTL